MSAPIPYLSHRQLEALLLSSDVEEVVARDIRRHVERFAHEVVEPLRHGVAAASLLTTHVRINIEMAPTVSRLLRHPAVVERLHQRLDQADSLHRQLMLRFDDADSFAGDLLREAHAIVVGVMRSVLASGALSSMPPIPVADVDNLILSVVEEGGELAMAAMLVTACEVLLDAAAPLPASFGSLCELASSSARSGLEAARQQMPYSMLPASSVVPIGFTREQWRERWRLRIVEATTS